MHEPPLPHWPAPERNKAPILKVLKSVLPATGVVLEIASGTGQHCEFFARELPHLHFVPSDFDPEHVEVLALRRSRSGLANLLPPIALDAAALPWPIDSADAIFNANMVHIAPWSVAEGLFAGAGSVLEPSARLITYGPYKIGGKHTAESNARFDASLRERDPAWGVRDLDALSALALRHGLALLQQVAMPANNFTLVWEKTGV